MSKENGGPALLKLPLESSKSRDLRALRWSSCLPFVENSRGVLIHRPRTGATYNIHKSGPHVGIGFWCGMSVSCDGKNLTFHATPPAGRIVCARCEAAAVASGMPSADELAGHHVHIGRTITAPTCCQDSERSKP